MALSRRLSRYSLAAILSLPLAQAFAQAQGARAEDEDVRVNNVAAIPSRDSAEMAWWRNSQKTRDQRLKWWRDARFGMFVHWGVYSTLGGTWQGKPVSGYAEHIQRKLKIPIDTYRKEVVSQFNPTRFDADEWIRLAKDAGMGYFVITAKHHDGVAMYPSAVSTYDIADGSPFKRDPMKELKAACDRNGVRFGFYYSHAFDWGDELAPGNDWDYQNPGGDLNLHGGRNWWEDPEGKTFLPRVRKYVDDKSIPQIRELIASYHPDIFWFDTPHKLPPFENYRILKAVREAAPDVVVNGRLLRGYGDYDSTADRPAEFAPHDGDWEGIPTTNESYGYNANDSSHKPPAHFIQLIAKAAARGGNLLMNIGPRGDGTIDPKDAEILRAIGAWMRVNGESIHGTTRTPLPVQAWGESTAKGDTLYLHVFDYPKDGRLVVGGVKSTPKSARLLADAGNSLAVTRDGDLDLIIQLPKAAPDPTDTVVALRFESADFQTDTDRLLSPDQTNTLRVFDGKLEGKTLKFGPGKKTDAYIQSWTEAGDGLVFPLRLTRPATFALSATYDAEKASAGNEYTITVGSQTVAGTVKAGTNVTEDLPDLTLQPGRYSLVVKARAIRGGELFRLRAVSFSPKN